MLFKKKKERHWLNNMVRKVRTNSSWLKSGIPFMLLIIGGSLGLSPIVGGQFMFRDVKVKRQSEEQYDIEEEHKKLMKKMGDLSDYKLIPVPRPSDETQSQRAKGEQS